MFVQMKQIAIITENFLVPWYPDDIDDFLGGSQECVVLLAEALNRQGYNVDVYTMGPTKINDVVRNGVKYREYSKFIVSNSYDTIILFKINPTDLQHPNIIYWSSDREERPKNKYINKYVCLTQYHKQRCNWTDALVIPHGIDTNSLLANRTKKIPNTMVYCSSLDRGLDNLLQHWPQIKNNHPNLKLYVTYGYKIVKQFINSPLIDKKEEQLQEHCRNMDIEYLGHISKDEMEKLYWKCQYWCLPLNNPDSELFCFNALKSRFCGCTPVVYKKGALTETVGSFIDFDDFVRGDLSVQGTNHPVQVQTWDDIINNYWNKII